MAIMGGPKALMGGPKAHMGGCGGPKAHSGRPSAHHCGPMANFWMPILVQITFGHTFLFYDFYSQVSYFGNQE